MPLTSPKKKKKREEQYELAFKGLKKEIRAKIKAVESINLNEVFEYENDEVELFNDWVNNLDSFVEIFEDKDDEYSEHNSAIKSLVSIREQCLDLDPKVVSIAENFGKDAEALSKALLFLFCVNEKSISTQLFKKAPKMDADKIEALEANLQAVKDAKKPIFAYSYQEISSKMLGMSSIGLLDIRQKLRMEKRASRNQRIDWMANQFYTEIEGEFSGSSEMIPIALDCFEDNEVPEGIDTVAT